MSRNRQTKELATSLAMILLSSPFAFAGSNPCVPLGSFVDGWAGDCLGGGFDSIEFAIAKSSYTMAVANDISANATPGTIFYPWSDVTLRGDGVKTNAVFQAFSDQTYQAVTSNRTLNLHQMTLDNINLELRYIDWNFNGADNKLTLKNGSRLANDIGGELKFLSTSPMTIHSASGDNEIFGLSYSEGTAGYSAPMTINVDGGSSLKLTYLGELSRGADEGFWKFSGTSSINVDNGLLDIDHSRFNFVDGTVNLSNTGKLNVHGSAAEFRAKSLNADSGSLLTLSNSTQFKVSGDTTITDSTLNLAGSRARFETSRLFVHGNSTIAGNGNTALLKTQYIEGSNGATLNVNDINQLRTETLVMSSGFDVNVNSANLRVDGNTVFNGGTINLTNAGQLSLFDKVRGTSGAININSAGLAIEQNSSLELIDNSLSLSLTGAGELTIFGEFYGGASTDRIGDAATNTIRIKGDDDKSYHGIISPGSENAGPGRDVIGTIITDSRIMFTGNADVQAAFPTSSAIDLLNTGVFDGGYYRADLRLNGSTPENDLISYGDGDVNLAAMKAIQVRVHGSPTAAQLDGKEFTIIAAQDSASAGQIVTLGQSVDIEEDANLPILIDFFIVDNQTNGKEDITLVAEEQLPITLKKHPNVRSRRNAQAVAALVPVSASGATSPSQPQTPAQKQAQQNVYNSLQTTTNAQVKGDFPSIHPETISSNMTVQLEQADNMLNTVLAVNTLAKATDDEMQNLGSFFFGSANSHPSGVWANINYVDGKVKGQGDLGTFDYYLTSYTFGSSFIRRSDYELGTFFGFSSESMDEHDEANIDFSSDAYHLGLYGGFRFNEELAMDWAFGHAWLNTESRRSVSLGNLQESAEAEYDSQMNYLGARASYDTSWLPKVDSAAYFGLSYLRVDQDAFSETNAPNLGLTIDRAIASSAIVSLGVEMSRALGQSESTRARTEVRYDYDALAEKNREHEIRASFNFDPSNTQSFVGQNRGEHAATLALGVDHEFEEDWLLSLAGAYTRSSHGYEVGGDLVMNWYW